MAGAVAELSDQAFETQVVQSPTPVLVDFWAEWCGPCRMLTPVIEQLAAEYDGKVKIFKLNVDQHVASAAKFNIMNIPTLLFFKGGREVDRVVGVAPKEALARKLDLLLQG